LKYELAVSSHLIEISIFTKLYAIYLLLMYSSLVYNVRNPYTFTSQYSWFIDYQSEKWLWFRALGLNITRLTHTF